MADTPPAGNPAPDGDHLRRHYGRKAARKSFRHFLVGKGFKTFGTLATLLILARWLDTEEYAIYIALRALVEIARKLTTIGITAVLYRYLPELRATGNSRSAYSLLVYGVGARIVAIGLVLLLAMQFLPQIGVEFKLEDWLWLVPWYLLIGALDFTTHTLSQAMESFLWQKEAQLSLAVGNLVQMLSLVALLWLGTLTLPTAVMAEAAGLLVALVLLLIGLAVRWVKDEERAIGEPGWIWNNRYRMLRFGAWTFALNLTSVGYGPGPTRLVAARYLSIADLATFGFAGQLGNLARRFMPSRLVSTMIRPLLLARFSVSGDFEKLVRMINLVYRINLSILALPIGMLLIGGEPIFDWLTDGKYGAAAPLLAGMLVVLISEGMRNLLELVIQAVEKNQIFAGSNLMLSLSLILGIWLVGIVGAWGLIIATFAGTVLANVILVIWLRYYGYRFSVAWLPVLQIVFYGATATGVGWFIATSIPGDFLGVEVVRYGLGMLAFGLIYIGLYWLKPPFSLEEREIVLSMIRKPRKRKNQAAPTDDGGSNPRNPEGGGSNP
ncbi:MAG: lipopolysaccharide biosynthesis protein [Thiohalocapsa sp.]|nr:lipopolysaccharide biosynthesis protein [Thiohalocapsa sp.]